MNDDKIREAFEILNPSVLIKLHYSDGKYYLNSCQYSPHTEDFWNHKFSDFKDGYKSAMQSAQEEIERLKCCGNCEYENDGEERCKLKSKGYLMRFCNWEAKK